MAITTLDLFIASAKQWVGFSRIQGRSAVASTWFSVFDLQGIAGSGVLAGANTANGVVPVAGGAGFPTINAFGASAKGYLAVVDFNLNNACRVALKDLLFKAGAYSFNSIVTLATQPSYSTRVPGGTDFTDCQIWLECVTAFTGTPSVAITYTNQAGVAGRTTGTISWGSAPIVGQMKQWPLQAGDTGVQKIESVTATVATVGTFNVLVTRHLWSGRANASVGGGDVHGLDKTGLREMFATSALFMQISPDSVATAVTELELTIANG